MKAFLKLFPNQKNSLHEVSEKHEKFIRKLVARYSRGNVNLQRGRYVTKKQKQERTKKILGYKFHSMEHRNYEVIKITLASGEFFFLSIHGRILLATHL